MPRATEAPAVSGYAPLQITLHWIVVVLVAFQFVANAAIVRYREAVDAGVAVSPTVPLLAQLHVITGVTILGLAILRLTLRWTRGVPAPPADEPRLQQFLSEAVHVAIYVLLFSLPASGAAAWFLDWTLAATVHGWLSTLLLWAIALHIAGALFQHFVRRSQVMIRMLQAEND